MTKFKYTYLTNQLRKIDGEYSYEILDKFHTNQGIYGTNIFQLATNEWIIFTLATGQIKVVYQHGKQTYQKNLEFPKGQEIVFEFTEQDQIN